MKVITFFTVRGGSGQTVHGVNLFTHKQNGHQRKRKDGHCCAYREVDAEIDIVRHKVGDQEQTDTHGT